MYSGLIINHGSVGCILRSYILIVSAEVIVCDGMSRRGRLVLVGGSSGFGSNCGIFNSSCR